MFHSTLAVGKSVLIRTVTYHHIGIVTDVDEGWIALSPAVWLAESGRLGAALKTGVVSECEELPDGVIVMRSAIVDVIPWKHAVPAGDQ